MKVRRVESSSTPEKPKGTQETALVKREPKYYKSMNGAIPEAINFSRNDNVRLIQSSAIKGPVVVGKRKHIYREERKLRDPVLGHTPEGKRIFALNEKGQPICFSRLANNRGRCRNVGIGLNGRCKYHGGRAPKGIDHYNATCLRSSDALPTFMQNDMRRAELDPDLLGMRHELKLLDVEEAELTRSLGDGISDLGMKKITTILRELEEKYNNDDIDTAIIENLLFAWKSNINATSIRKRLDSIFETRRKISETQHKREKDLNQMLRHEQAMTLVGAIAGVCRREVTGVLTDIENRYLLIDRKNLPALVNKAIRAIEGISAYISCNIDPKIADKFRMKISTSFATLTSGSRERTFDVNDYEDIEIKQDNEEEED